MLIKKDVNEYPVVMYVCADTPAYEAGISAGDSILAIDGDSTLNMDLDIVLGRIRGIDGTLVNLSILSGGEQSVRTLARKSPDIQLVFASMVNEKIGYINILEFSGDSVAQFDDAIKTLNKEKAEAAVIDLRGTLGGNISQAAEIADKLLDAGTITYTEGKNRKNNVWESNTAQSWTKPIVLLVDEDTAGVAEVFAAAIRDRQRGTILGCLTAGKAVVTSFFEIQATGDVIKLVTANYYSPNGVQIGNSGVVPDVYVVATSDTEDTALSQAAEQLNAMLP